MTRRIPKTCMVCQKVYTVLPRLASRSKRCPACQIEHKRAQTRERLRERYHADREANSELYADEVRRRRALKAQTPKAASGFAPIIVDALPQPDPRVMGYAPSKPGRFWGD